MSETDLIGRQISALEQLGQRIKERSEVEFRAEKERSEQAETAEQAFQRTKEVITSRNQKEESEVRQRAQAEPEAIRQQFEAHQATAEKALRVAKHEAATKHRDEAESAKKAQGDKRWEAGTIYEAAILDSKGRHDAILGRLTIAGSRIKSLREQTVAHLTACRQRFEPPEEAPSPPARDRDIPPEEVEQAVQTAGETQAALLKLGLPRLFQGAKPVLVLVLLWPVLALPLGFLLGWTNGLIAGTLATLIFGTALIFYLSKVAKVQVSRTYPAFREAIERAEALARRSRQDEAARYKREQAEITERRDREQSQADLTAQKLLLQSRQRHDEIVRKAEEQYQVTLAEQTRQRDESLKRVEEETSRRLPEIQGRFEKETTANQEQFDRQTKEIQERHANALQQMTERWRNGLAQIQDELETIRQRDRELFPPWNEQDWPSWKAPKVLPPAIRFGEIRVGLDQFPNGFPHDPRLMEGLPSEFTLPAFLDCPDGCSVLLKAGAEGHDPALQTLQAIMLRLLTGLPPGKARFTILDPVGLGQNFAAFMHLADYDEQLVTSRIWTEAQHIEQRLADITEHMENVIQKYLRNEFSSISEYNEKAGEVAEPFRFLVVADFPVNFNESSARRLLSIAASGARCGVHTLILVDTRRPLPQGIDLKDLEKHSVTLNWREGRFQWKDPILGQYPLKLDTPPPADRFTGIVQVVGKKAEGASRVEVPFEHIAPAADQYWKADSRGGIDVPLGRAGATKLQHLRLGEGTSQHVLIAGKTGSGKSTLLHALITNTALIYSPEEVELYLVDFKKGVEFKTYAVHELPHARVVAVESEREFGLSVLQRLDAELKRRGDLYRTVGAQDLASYRGSNGRGPMPRILLIVDEFQEFFVEDDKIAQEASLLLDRLVRQGRAFGIHVHLGSQTLAGAYSLARATIGQMGVRVALQCSESDAHLILSDENSAARLLSRPGEAIYNDANGMIEGNHFFQVVWLPDERREVYLEKVKKLAKDRGYIPPRPPVIFEGSVAPEIRRNDLLGRLLASPDWPLPVPKADNAWLGEAIAIKDPTAMTFRRQGGNHLLIVGQNEEAALGLMATSLVSLAAHRDDSTFAILDGTPADSPRAGLLETVARVLPQEPKIVSFGEIPEMLETLAGEVTRRQIENLTDAPPIYLLIQDLQRFRNLRKQEDDFSFSRRADDEPTPPSEHLGTILRDGPVFGIHALIWCDTVNNLNRAFDRSTLRELETRVLFQMSAGDSSTLIDSPLANRLGMQRGLLVSEEQGLLEKFRPYSPPAEDWIEEVGQRLQSRTGAG